MMAATNVSLSFGLSSTRSSETTKTTPPSFRRTEMARRAISTKRFKGNGSERNNKKAKCQSNGSFFSFLRPVPLQMDLSKTRA
jgi:hypothetical protein